MTSVTLSVFSMRTVPPFDALRRRAFVSLPILLNRSIHTFLGLIGPNDLANLRDSEAAQSSRKARQQLNACRSRLNGLKFPTNKPIHLIIHRANRILLGNSSAIRSPVLSRLSQPSEYAGNRESLIGLKRTIRRHCVDAEDAAPRKRFRSLPNVFQASSKRYRILCKI